MCTAKFVEQEHGFNVVGAGFHQPGPSGERLARRASWLSTSLLTHQQLPNKADQATQITGVTSDDQLIVAHNSAR